MLSFIAMAMIATAAPAPKLDLSSEDRWALLSSLGQRLDGSFIITGLKDADKTCRMTNRCATGDAVAAKLKASAPDVPVTSVKNLIAVAEIDGRRPNAIVSLRSARWLRYDRLEITASVYDAATDRWSVNVGVIDTVAATTVQPVIARRRLQSWTEKN